MSALLEGYLHIGISRNVCNGRPIIIGTRIEPINIVNYGTLNEAMEDFGLTEDQVKECYQFMGKRIFIN